MTNVELNSLSPLGDQRKAKAEQARSLIAATINSTGFQSAMRSATFSDVRLQRRDGTVTTTLTNEQILNVILSGAEEGTAADGVLTLKVIVYYKMFSSAIGFTRDGIIHTRDRFFDSAEVVELAGHWIHEWTHTAGFVHDYNRTARRDMSVPYLVGDLLIESARTIL